MHIWAGLGLDRVVQWVLAVKSVGVRAGSMLNNPDQQGRMFSSFLLSAETWSGQAETQRPQTLVAHAWHHGAKSGFLRPPKQHQTQVQMKVPAPGARTPSPDFLGCLEQYKHK